MSIQLVGISGRKRAGKDSLANFLVERHGFTRIGFADALKNVAADLDPIIDVHLSGIYGGAVGRRLSAELAESGWEAAKESPEVRRLLQRLGTAIREHVDGGVWIEAAILPASEIIRQGGRVVIPDVRFPNEADVIRGLGGIIVRVERSGPVSPLTETDLHISETAMDDYAFDRVVFNASTLDALGLSADQIAKNREL